MKARRNAETHPWLKSYLSNICIAAEALKNPVDDIQRDKLLANISFQAAKIAAHRQAQGGGR